MKQEYKIFQSNASAETIKTFWKECEDKQIVYLIASKKWTYTRVEWDYYTLQKLQKVNNFSNCPYNKEIEKVYNEYIKKVTLPKNKQTFMSNTDIPIGMFYIRNIDIDIIMPKLCKIFNDMITSDCIDITSLKEYINSLSPEEEKVFNLMKYN